MFNPADRPASRHRGPPPRARQSAAGRLSRRICMRRCAGTGRPGLSWSRMFSGRCRRAISSSGGRTEGASQAAHFYHRRSSMRPVGCRSVTGIWMPAGSPPRCSVGVGTRWRGPFSARPEARWPRRPPALSATRNGRWRLFRGAFQRRPPARVTKTRRTGTRSGTVPQAKRMAPSVSAAGSGTPSRRKVAASAARRGASACSAICAPSIR